MTIQEIEQLYGRSPQANAFLSLLKGKSVRSVSLQGLLCSSVPMFFAPLQEKIGRTVLFVLNDADEAGYFYHDLTQMMGQENTFFFPSSYRRAIKYGQRDAASEILRTEVLARLSSESSSASGGIYIVSYPAALAEMVIGKQQLDDRILRLQVGQQVSLTDVVHTLRDFELVETDYVYEPGQFAVRGSILDVYSYSCEYPFRIDFFGDEIDTIRTFDVENQLSKDKRELIEIVPELASVQSIKQSFLSFLPSDALVVMKDYTFVHDSIEKIYEDGFSAQIMQERLEGANEMEAEKIMHEMKKEFNLVTPLEFQKGVAEHQRVVLSGSADSSISFQIAPQPLFHKNFELLTKTLEDYQLQGYTLFILADSLKQQQRLKDIFSSEELKRYNISFTSVDKTIHEGFID